MSWLMPAELVPIALITVAGWAAVWACSWWLEEGISQDPRAIALRVSHRARKLDGGEDAAAFSGVCAPQHTVPPETGCQVGPMVIARMCRPSRMHGAFPPSHSVRPPPTGFMGMHGSA